MSASPAPVPPVLPSAGAVVRPRPAVPLAPCDPTAAAGPPPSASAAPPPALARLQRATTAAVQTLERRPATGEGVAAAVGAAAEAQAVFRSGLAPAERDIFDAHVAAAVLRSVCAVAEQLWATADSEDARATADRLCGLVATTLARHNNSSNNSSLGSVAAAGPAVLPSSVSVPDLRMTSASSQQASPPTHGRRRHLVSSGTLLPFLDDGKERDADESGKVCVFFSFLFFLFPSCGALVFTLVVLCWDAQTQKVKIPQLAGRPVVCENTVFPCKMFFVF